MTLDDAGPAEQPVQHHDTTTLHGSLTSPVARSGVVVLFYEDDNKTAFEMEVLPRLRTGVAHQVRAPYHATSCGAHDILMITAPGKKAEAHRYIGIDVDCSAPTPTATPAVRGSDNDDGSAMQTTTRPNHGIWLRLGGTVLLLRRYRARANDTSRMRHRGATAAR